MWLRSKEKVGPLTSPAPLNLNLRIIILRHAIDKDKLQRQRVTCPKREHFPTSPGNKRGRLISMADPPQVPELTWSEAERQALHLSAYF